MYTDDVTFCSDGSYCCGNNNTACCSSNKGNLEISMAILAQYLQHRSYSQSITLACTSRQSHVRQPSHLLLSRVLKPPQRLLLPRLPLPLKHKQALHLQYLRLPLRQQHFLHHLILPFSSAINTTATASSTSSSHSRAGNGALNEKSKMAISISTAMAFLAIGFIAWWLLKRRRSHAVTSSHDETDENDTANAHAPEPHPPGELPTGLDRAELVTSHWASAELPFGHEIFEIAHPSLYLSVRG